MQDSKNFKILLLGDSGVGKTTFLRRHKTGEFETVHTPTLGVDVQNMSFRVRSARTPAAAPTDVTLTVWDSAGDARYGGARKEYHTGAHAALIFYDCRESKSVAAVRRWLSTIVEPIPVVLCGNKHDLASRDGLPAGTASVVPAFYGATIYDLSAKSNYNYDRPILSLLRTLMNDTELEFAEMPALAPPEVCVAVTSAAAEKGASARAELKGKTLVYGGGGKRLEPNDGLWEEIRGEVAAFESRGDGATTLKVELSRGQ